MRTRLKNIVKKAKGISLSSDEKDSIKHALLKHIEDNPLVEESGSFQIHKRVSYSEWVGNYFNNKKLMVPSALLLLLVLTGGISFASSNALPGSLLYPVKILNEKVGLAFATDQKEKVKMLTLNANTRLEEAEALYTQGKLDQKTETDLAESFEEDSVQANVTLEHLQKDDKGSSNEEATRFRGDLDKHQKIIGSLRSQERMDTSPSGLAETVSKVIAKFDLFLTPSDDIRMDDIKKKVETKTVFAPAFSKPKEVIAENKGTTTIVENEASTTMLAASTTAETSTKKDTVDSSDFNTRYESKTTIKTETKSSDSSSHNGTINVPSVHIETHSDAGGSLPGIHL
ncbi:MAG: DUF5667 domain-containing protein [Patescibacteria group bacterium]